MVLVFEMPVELDDIWMVEFLEYLKLINEAQLDLVVHLRLFYLLDGPKLALLRDRLRLEDHPVRALPDFMQDCVG